MTLSNRFFDWLVGGKFKVSYPQLKSLSDISGNRDKFNLSTVNGVTIREITFDDIGKCLSLVKRHHNTTYLSEFNFSEVKCLKQLRRVLANLDNELCLVAEKSGDVVGLVWVTLGGYYLSDEVVFANCQLVTVEHDALGKIARIRTFSRLIRAANHWSKKRGANQFLIHVTTGVRLKATDKMILALGGKRIGGGYVFK